MGKVKGLRSCSNDMEETQPSVFPVVPSREEKLWILFFNLAIFNVICIVRTLGNMFSSLGTADLLAAGQSPGKLGDRICLGSLLWTSAAPFILCRNKVLF